MAVPVSCVKTLPQVKMNGGRWNPTREQVAVLEALYIQGIRTPNAQEIERIAGMLRQYGSIEGKNVFYWFQNHKARQRLKLKQHKESLLYFSFYLHHPQHTYPPPLSYLNNGVLDSENLHSLRPLNEVHLTTHPLDPHDGYLSSIDEEVNATLELFPLHPEGLGCDGYQRMDDVGYDP